MFELAVAPLVATSRHPSSCSIRNTSLTFTEQEYQGLSGE